MLFFDFSGVSATAVSHEFFFYLEFEQLNVVILFTRRIPDDDVLNEKSHLLVVL